MFTFTAAETGKNIRFKLLATNEIGSTLSKNYLQVLLAGTPPTPIDKVQKVLSDTQKIVVVMPEVINNGGSTLMAYELMADDGLQGDL